MEILQFIERNNRYVITMKSSGDTRGLWDKFAGRIAEGHDYTASTYCEYTTSSEGGLKLKRYDIDVDTEQLKSVELKQEKTIWRAKDVPPVVYETGGKYHFLIEIKGIKGKASLIHPMKDVTDGFDYISTGDHKGMLMGVIDFLNQPGSFSLRFHYTDIEGRSREEFLTFEVVSPKMDTKHDLKEIKRLIDEEYKDYIYQYLALTFQSQKLQRADNPNDNVWMSIFNDIVTRYVDAVRYIEHHSNLRSVRAVYYQKPDRIKRWDNHELEKMKARGKDADRFYYRNQVTEHTINTRENRFVKYTLKAISDRLAEVFTHIEEQYGESISKEYKDQIKKYRDDFKQMQNSKFFRCVGKFEGQMQESQVMQQRAGYRNVYVCWQMLKSVIHLEDGSTQIGIRQIWKLYEIWCYLVMKRLICKVLGIDSLTNTERVETYGATMLECLDDEKKSCRTRFYFDETENHVGSSKTAYAELIYQCRYKYDESATEEHSLTIEQIPDIVLNIHRKGKETLTYIFDAKYRVQDDKAQNVVSPTDEPIHETINTMHHYRDAIYYGTMPERMQGVSRPDSKEVIGGYILFPGRVGSDERLEDKYYIKSIESINIGAFPVMPAEYDVSKGMNQEFVVCDKLEKHLEKLLKEKHVVVHVGKSVPQRGLRYTDDPELALAKKWERKKVLVFVATTNDILGRIDKVNGIAITLELNKHALQTVKKFSKAKYVYVTNRSDKNYLFKVKGEPQLSDTVDSEKYILRKFHCDEDKHEDKQYDVGLVFDFENIGEPLIRPKIDNKNVDAAKSDGEKVQTLRVVSMKQIMDANNPFDGVSRDRSVPYDP